MQGIKKFVNGIALRNPKSERLHAKLGFKLVGTYINAAFMRGNRYNVSWFENNIGDHTLNLALPVSICELPKEEIN